MPRLDPVSSSHCSPIAGASTIKIRELECRGITQRGTRQWRVSVSTGGVDSPRIVSLTDPFDKTQDKSLKWAVEDYPTQRPFETARSLCVQKELWRYGISLVDQLCLHDLVVSSGTARPSSKESMKRAPPTPAPTPPPPETWILEIEAYEEKGRFHNLHWEILEHPRVWTTANSFRESPRIIVRRKLHSKDLLTHGRMIAVRSAEFRILMVVSHSMSAVAANGRKTPNPRLHARPLMDLIDEIKKKDDGAAVSLEIVRPGTWKALREHFERRGKGFFHLVHFDVHARWDEKENQTELAFISDNSTRKRSWRGASEVSKLLADFSVKIVILNAQRSSGAFGVCEASLAERLVDNGVRAVIAMPYKILNAGAEALMSTFYRSFLTGTWDLGFALADARAAMIQNRLRDGRFGTRVEVGDWIAPVLYHNGGTEVALSGADILMEHENIFSGSKLKAKGGRLVKGGLKVVEEANMQTALECEKLVGRDGDIFDLETRFLGEYNVLRLHGSPGVGKTALAMHLGWWWRATSLITDYLYFDFHQRSSLNVEMICRQIYLTLFPPAQPTLGNREKSPSRDRRKARPSISQPIAEIFPENWMHLMTQKLRETPYLIVIDSFDAPYAVMNQDGKTRKAFHEFLRGIQGGKSYVILVTNKKYGWIDETTFKMTNYHLKGLEMNQALELAFKLLNQHGDVGQKFEGHENQLVLEKILKLCDNNPLIMELLLPHMAQRDESPQAMYVSLLQGCIPLGTEGVASVYATKSMHMLGEMMKRLDIEAHRLLLALAPFWSVVPKDIEMYLMCLVHHRAFVSPDRSSVRPTTARSDVSRMTSGTTRLMDVDSASTRGLETRYESIIQELLCLDLLREEATNVEGGPEERARFYGIHPLLTLYLRQALFQAGPEVINPDGLQKAYQEFYSRRSSAWDIFPDQPYEVTSQHFANEATNFLSCVSIPLHLAAQEKCFGTFPIHVFVRFGATSLVDAKLANLAPLIAYFAKQLLKRFEELRVKRGPNKKVGDSPLTIALYAAEWLCEYHAAHSGPAEFKVAAENSLQLIQMAEDTNSKAVDLLSNLQEQSAKQKAWAASTGMISGLRLRPPFAGLTASDTDTASSPPRSAAATTGQLWTKLAAGYTRVHSIAVQSQLSIFFADEEVRTQLRKDLKALWQGAVKNLRPTVLAPLTRSYDWVSALLSPDYTPLPNTPQIPLANFHFYPSFLRAQTYLLLRDADAAKHTLLTALPHAQAANDTKAETMLHLRLADLTYTTNHHAECIAHAEFIRDILEAIPDSSLTADDHKAYAEITLRKGLCHRELREVEAAMEFLEVSAEVSAFCRQPLMQYSALRKLASIKRETGHGSRSLADITLAALDIAYDRRHTRNSPLVDEQGVLLRRLVVAVHQGKAGEGMREVVARICERLGGEEDRVRGFLEEVQRRERELLARLVGGERKEVARWIEELWRDAEVWLWAGRGGRGRMEAGARWRGTMWEGGVVPDRR